MKKLNYVLAITLMTIFSFTISGCSDPCDGITCNEKGTCIDGTCMCEDGYEGENCEIELREKYLGDWISTDYKCGSNPNGVDFNFTIERGVGGLDLVFTFPGISDLVLDASVEENRAIIPLQSGVGNMYQGDLSVNAEGIANFLLLIDNNIANLTCSCTAVQ